MTQRRINMLKYVLIVILSFPIAVLAQDNWNQEGDLEDSQVIIEKDRKIDLARVNRDFKKVPNAKSSQSSIDVKFNSKQFIPELNKLSPRIRVLTIQDEKLEKLYGSQVRLGGGNYGASYFEGNFSSKRNKDKSYGLNLLHQSFANGPIDGRNSGSGYQNINPYGKFIFQNAALSADAFYERNNNYLYGYDTTLVNEVDRDSIQRTYHSIGANIKLEDRNDNSNYHYKLGLNSYQLFSNIENSEFSFNYALDNSYDINEDISAYFNLNGFLSNLNFNAIDSSQNRNLIRFQPGIHYNWNDLRIKAGIIIAYENDTLENLGKTHLFPDLNAEYTVFDKLSLFIGLKGDIRANQYRSFLNENPYLDNTIPVFNTLMPLKFYGGVNGAISNVLGYEVGGSIASVQYNYGFAAIFDESEGELRYAPRYFTEKNTEANAYLALSTNLDNLNIDLRGDYFYYNVGDNQLMPFRPQFRLKLNSDYVIADKLKIGLNAHLQGAMNNENIFLEENANYSFNIDEAIPPIYDLGIKLAYQLSNRSQIFLHANNLIANKYEYFLGYPNRGFQVLGGFTYSF
ncbi:hypothetical protein QYS48_33730 [Marivirga arenosa]|uniref:TonB-dependent receptor n=1 Tax=Marivirga arenosa TaxID=3059076 RepID=A0AA51N5Q2_9BACT|nr:hypothetical protein [Marivirga sp. ABR2-2]WMN06791.1 hypothetical protein QYS48_33730 [Marivirga sp. ABR2-2]